MAAEMSCGDEPPGGHTPVTRGEVLTVSAALGTGDGANIAIQAGAATGAAAIPIYAAAASGVAASGLVGWEVGTSVNDIPIVEKYLNWLTDALAFGAHQPTGPLDPMLPHLTAPNYPELNSTVDLDPNDAPQDIWWSVREVGDMIGSAANVYANPYDAVEVIGSNGGSGLYFLIGNIATI